MAKTVGARKDRRALFGVITGVVAALGVVGITVQHGMHARAEGEADYKAWVVTGPACPAPASPGFDAAAGDHGQPMTVGDVTFTRAHGASLCTDVHEDGGKGQNTFTVCQFDRPGTLSVTTAKGTVWFRAGYQSPATVSVHKGVASCVIGASRDFGHTLIYDKPAAGSS